MSRTKKVKAFFHKPKKVKDEEKEKENEREENEFYLNTLTFKLNNNIKPPYFVILDTNFKNFSIKRKIDIRKGMLSCLVSNAKLFVTECVIAELEKLGRPYRVALALVKGDDFIRLECDHKGTYADDCIINRVNAMRCYIVATCDTELKNRIRKIGGIPIISVGARKYILEGK